LSAPSSISPTEAVIDLSALTHNLKAVQQRLNGTCEILAVLKADAYGHGALPIARTLAALGVTRFGVASCSEGIALRRGGIGHQILVLGPLFPEQVSALVAHRLTPVISQPDQVRALTAVLKPEELPYPVHIKVETGMGRLGLDPETVPDFLCASAFTQALRAEGLMTHLADADNEDERYTKEQLALLQSLLNRLEASGLKIPIIHAANSAGILAHPSSYLTLVRPGLLLYGYAPHPRLSDRLQLTPVLTLTTKIAQIRLIPAGASVSYGRSYRTTRPTRVAILPLGYADGYSRALSNRGAVLIKGRRAPIVGRVCMDMTMVDVTHIADIDAGEPVTVLGRQGPDAITAWDLAAWLNSIPYEILCAIGPRIPRTYVPPLPPA
jgi:alanine racemase